MAEAAAFGDRVQLLARRLEDAGEWVSLDGRVNAATVAKILGRSEKTLRRWRAAADIIIPFTRIRGVATYALADVLRYVESGQVETENRAA